MMQASPSKLLWQRFKSHPIAIASLGLLITFAVFAIFAPLIENILDVSATDVDLFNRFTSPSVNNILGTDELGRDILVRLLYGAQISLSVGITAALIASFFGTIIGLAAGYTGGRLDAILMRMTDGIIALPLLPLLIVLAALDLSKLGLPDTLVNSENISHYRIILIVALAGWTTTARLVRGSTLSLRERDFVLAAKAQGSSNFRIMFIHILPNLASSIIVATTLSVGNIILLESVLSFLGLGIQPPTPSWGNMLTNAQELIWDSPVMAFYPGILIFLTVIAFNFIGDGLQNALNPRNRNN
ncbi:MAG: ABC transporter permease [Rhodospirillales bacterium]|jgi:peptide/nickel transport system permease protein|nr:ABC transporter permease [Rhodospirillales bacterium]